jgi:D-beta-D-heptose 7-phosphate kinase/D-beta-D-heptose 1-phosphate adenosyltransferase
MLTHEKLKTPGEVQEILAAVREKGGISVFTSGCFDVLHPGHVQYLEASRNLGDLLILGLNSDASIRRIKGDARPIIPEDARAFMLASLSCVDYIVLFEEDTPTRLIGSNS